MNKIDILNKWIKESKKTVFFGGAGVSTESGMKDFRSKDGLYNEKYDYPPETILSHAFFINNTKEFYNFYYNKMNSLKYKPNITHKVLFEMENNNLLSSIITQNIDGLHQEAGSKKVYELHGSIHRNYCMKCHKFYEASYIFKEKGIPICECGGIIKPDVVLYEENLDDKVVEKAIKEIGTCELLIIGGTSMTVYPAASLIHYFKGKYLVIINTSITPYDSKANLVIEDKLGNVFRNIKTSQID